MKKIMNHWFKLSDKIRFLFVGSFNAGVQYLMYVGLCLIFSENFYQCALALSWGFSSIISFSFQKYLVFETKGNFIKEYLKCLLTWSVSYLINALLLEVFVKYLKINVFLAQIIATISVAIITYVLFKKFAFKKK